jgi:hypothetical protein
MAGCGRRTVPDYDGKESRLLTGALQELRDGDPKRSLTALQKLSAVDPESRLPDLALAHERDRELVVRLNRHLQAGELEKAGEILRYQRRYGDMGTSLMSWSELPDALRAMERYVEAKPYVTSAKMREALARLDDYRNLLDHSPTFLAFHGAEESELKRLVARERKRITWSLLCDLDALVLVGDPRAEQILAEIVATVGTDHPLPATVRAVALGDWRKVRELSEASAAGLYQSEYLEIAFAMFWDELPGNVRRALGRGLVRLPPCTLSGLLLHSRYAAYYGRMDDAVIYLRELSSSVQMTPRLVGQVLERLVLPRASFRAPCWQRPVPGVTDFLGRLDQLRDHVRASEK